MLYLVSTPITAIRDRCSSFCTWPTYSPLSPESFSRCRLRWTTPPSPQWTFVFTVHLFLYECITCKVKSCLSNYCTFHISYVTTNTQKYKITSMKKYILGSCWSGQRFSSASRLMFSIAMHWGKKSPWTHPLRWSVVMSSHAAFMASNWDIWSCGLWSYTFHLHASCSTGILEVVKLHTNS